MTDQELDEVYTEACRTLGRIGEEKAQLYLARLVLLLMLRLDEPNAICTALVEATDGL